MADETGIRLPIRMVLFDYGNVLEFFDHRRAIARFCEGTDLDVDELLRRLLVPGSPLLLLETGQIDAVEYRRFVETIVGRTFDDADFNARHNDMFEMRTDTIDLMKALRGRFRMGLLSNTNEIHFRGTISKHPCFSFFDQVTLSFEVNAVKPDPAIYRDALAKAAGIRAGEILFLDDVPAYAAAARAQGMQALVYDRAGETAAHVRRALLGENLSFRAT